MAEWLNDGSNRRRLKKAQIAFLATGGTRGDFAREWPSVFLEDVRGQRKSDAVSGN